MDRGGAAASKADDKASIRGRRKSLYKDPEVRMCLVCSRKSKRGQLWLEVMTGAVK